MYVHTRTTCTHHIYTIFTLCDPSRPEDTAHYGCQGRKLWSTVGPPQAHLGRLLNRFCNECLCMPPREIYFHTHTACTHLICIIFTLYGARGLRQWPTMALMVQDLVPLRHPNKSIHLYIYIYRERDVRVCIYI